MASPDWPYYSRISSFPDMFSFSLNPEILSFLWASSQSCGDINSVLKYRVPSPSQLLHIVLPTEPEEATVLSTLRYTVVTTGILVVVGISSICAFKLLQRMRQGLSSPLLENVKTLAVHITKPFALHWRKFKGDDGINEPIVSQVTEGTKPIFRRPSELQLFANGSPRGNGRFHGSRDNSLERRLVCKAPTPLADCDIASGEEEIGEIQGQYFGPNVGSKTICMELLGSSSDDSPTHALSPYKDKRSPKKGKHLGRESSC